MKDGVRTGWAMLMLLAATCSAAQTADPLLARSLAAGCANCHGTAGVARAPIKSLAGRPAADLLKLLADFRSGAQPATVMHQIAKGYSEEQLTLIARHFAALPAGRS